MISNLWIRPSQYKKMWRRKNMFNKRLILDISSSIMSKLCCKIFGVKLFHSLNGFHYLANCHSRIFKRTKYLRLSIDNLLTFSWHFSTTYWTKEVINSAFGLIISLISRIRAEPSINWVTWFCTMSFSSTDIYMIFFTDQ